MTLSRDFIEKAATLLLTAVLTGVLVPLLFRVIDAQRNREQKVFEAELLRQNKIIDSQVKLLEDLSSLLWDYQLLLIEVPYYRQFSERDLFPAALKAYEENAGKLLSKIRAEISKALRLTPYPIYEDLKSLYYKNLLPLDLKISQLATSEARNQDQTAEWKKLNHYAVYELSEIVDNIIDKLANELKLKALNDHQLKAGWFKSFWRT
jgi:hypothetical protein